MVETGRYHLKHGTFLRDMMRFDPIGTEEMVLEVAREIDPAVSQERVTGMIDTCQLVDTADGLEACIIFHGDTIFRRRHNPPLLDRFLKKVDHEVNKERDGLLKEHQS